MTNCAILPLPDCGTGSDIEQRVLHGEGGDATNDDTYFGALSMPQSYQTFNDRLRALSVVRGGPQNVAPTHLYLGDYPNPAFRSASQLCDSTTGPLHNDTLGFLSQADATYAVHVTNLLNGSVHAAANTFAAPMTDGRGGWTEVADNSHAFDANGMCAPAGQRFLNTGADGLAATGNNLGPPLHVLDVSASIMHPNNLGYEKLADGLEPMIRSQLDDMIAAVPATPTRFRQVSATVNGAMGLRWDDKANNEDKYDVLSRPAGSSVTFIAQPGPQLPADTTQLTLNPGQAATLEAKVRVCTRFAVCRESDPILISNEAPTVPSGLAVNPVVNPLATSTGQSVTLNVAWASQAKNVSVNVVIRAQVGTSDRVRDFRVDASGVTPPATFTLAEPIDPATAAPRSPIPTGNYIVRVQGCNLLGCSATGDAVTVPVAVISGLAPPVTVPPRTTPFTTVPFGK